MASFILKSYKTIRNFVAVISRWERRHVYRSLHWPSLCYILWKIHTESYNKYICARYVRKYLQRLIFDTFMLNTFINSRNHTF